MNLQTLKDELATDPEAIGYAGMTDDQAATALNTANRSAFQPISGAALLRWAAGGANDAASPAVAARIVRIKLASELAAPFNSLSLTAQGYAAAAVAAIGAAVPLSYEDAAVRAMIAQLATAGVLSSSEADELAALGTQAISRAAELGLGTVRVGEVTQAKAM